MPLRCLLFSSDPGTAEPICQVLAGLGVEGEHCPDAASAVEKVGSQPYQIVLVDWDNQPEAGILLQAARERKASERPLTLAIVSEDASVPKALQAGANSILRRPILINQIKDTLTTARDMVRARESAAQAVAAGAGAAASAAGSSSASSPASSAATPAGSSGKEATLRAGEFLQSSASAPGAHFDTESEMQKSMERSAGQGVDPLKDLETVASALRQQPAAPPPSAADGPRGLQWYLNQRAASAPAPAQPAAPAPPPPAPAKPELLGFDQIPTYTEKTTAAADNAAEEAAAPSEHHQQRDQKAEAQLFAYIASGSDEPRKKEAGPRIRLGKGPIFGALALAACAVLAAPQAPWHPQVRGLWGRGQRVLHGWLNPQPVTTAPAPASHENFGRAGDEYKLPVAENIPDATTDPSQIRVTPVIDPTAKKPNNAGGNADPNAVPADGTTNPVDPAQTPTGQTTGTQAQGNPSQGSPSQGNQGQDQNQGSQPPQTTPVTAPPAATTGAAPTGSAAAPPHADPFTPSSSTTTASAQPAPPRNPQPRPAAAAPNPPIPSSLKSQMASMTPDASGNKAPEAAMPSIEPVSVPEGAERALLTDQPGLVYPPNAKAQQGTVVLQVLIGRDGTVQDAKFLQGSLAFARTAIDGVKQWKFKPYTMNGRAVSVQTLLTISFKPGQ
jgi:periplasmic protein TonB